MMRFLGWIDEFHGILQRKWSFLMSLVAGNNLELMDGRDIKETDQGGG